MVNEENIISELITFCEELESYQEYMNTPGRLGLEEQRKVRKLRETLVRKTGAYKALIVEVTNIEYGSRLGNSFNLWHESFKPSSSYCKFSLSSCIHATNQAIGKLDSDIKNGIRNQKTGLIQAEQNLNRSGVDESLDILENLVSDVNSGHQTFS